MPPKVDRLIEEHNQLRGEMTAFTGIWRDCADHALPHRALTINTTSNVYRPDPKIHSDVATDALNTLASGLLGWT